MVQGSLFPLAKTRSRPCAQCGGAFTVEVGTGAPLLYCSDFCRQRASHRHRLARPPCTVDGCVNPRGYTGGLCNSCWYRQRRTGTTARKTFAYRWRCSTGYVKVLDKGHPLAAQNGQLFEHRQVLWNAIGAGPHRCHWCQTSVDWVRGASSKGALVVDHLDGDKANNQRSNLVPACNPCNSSRGMFMGWVRAHRDDPVLWGMYEASRHHAQKSRGE